MWWQHLDSAFIMLCTHWMQLVAWMDEVSHSCSSCKVDGSCQWTAKYRHKLHQKNWNAPGDSCYSWMSCIWSCIFCSLQWVIYLPLFLYFLILWFQFCIFWSRNLVLQIVVIHFSVETSGRSFSSSAFSASFHCCRSRHDDCWWCVMW